MICDGEEPAYANEQYTERERERDGEIGTKKTLYLSIATVTTVTTNHLH